MNKENQQALFLFIPVSLLSLSLQVPCNPKYQITFLQNNTAFFAAPVQPQVKAK